MLKKITSFLVALVSVFVLSAGTANALSVTWAFLFPVPLPLPVWDVQHPDSIVTVGYLFPVWLPLPFYKYGSRGPLEPRFSKLKNGVVPADSKVYIDGDLVGIASDYRTVDSLPVFQDGPHTFELKSDGQLIYAAQFNVKDGVVERAKQ
jgi:hypothetical protein